MTHTSNCAHLPSGSQNPVKSGGLDTINSIFVRRFCCSHEIDHSATPWRGPGAKQSDSPRHDSCLSSSLAKDIHRGISGKARIRVCSLLKTCHGYLRRFRSIRASRKTNTPDASHAALKRWPDTSTTHTFFPHHGISRNERRLNQI
jgi:hypothetical protein